MRKLFLITLILIITFCFCKQKSFAQERVGPLENNSILRAYKPQASIFKITATDTLTLPFFEDFTGTNEYYGYSPYPDVAKWEDQDVYINNTMGDGPISRGVATFDALNKDGLPYDSSASTKLLLADRLTSRVINLAGKAPSDSIYFSFFYQPQGNGFAPETQDSLMLFFKTDSVWVKVWAKDGTNDAPFKQVMIPVTDTLFLNSGFQFRFMNKASINTNDDVWNIDYIQMAVGRNINDTVINDVAFIADPGFLLNDYTYMPYNQFLANANGERATQITTKIRNNSNAPQSVTYTGTATCQGNTLDTQGPTNISISPYSEQTIIFPTYTNTVAPPPVFDDWVTFENKYFIQSISATDHKENDTIIREQTFHNELAYDDGTAEKSYYLNLFTTLPGKTAVEYHLNIPDTLKGVAIYFGRQVPLGFGKFFSIAVYNELPTSGPDAPLYEEDLYVPGYLNVNNFYVYQFTTPILLPKGTFYVGTVQPALSNSDSLYLGLDVNRVGGNHLYYNVLGYWQSSIVTGAVMIRPVFGPIIASNVADVKTNNETKNWSVNPNPVRDKLQVHFDGHKQTAFEIYDMQGRQLKTGDVLSGQTIEVADLLPGIYFIRLSVDGVATKPEKIIKL